MGVILTHSPQRHHFTTKLSPNKYPNSGLPNFTLPRGLFHLYSIVMANSKFVYPKQLVYGSTKRLMPGFTIVQSIQAATAADEV
jgi:hypothetical protein